MSKDILSEVIERTENVRRGGTLKGRLMRNQRRRREEDEDAGAQMLGRPS